MQVGILKTDGGPHPAEKWARMTAWMLSNHLINVDENASSPRAVAIREARDELNGRLYKVLKEHHGAVQTGERAKLKEHGSERLSLGLRNSEEARDAAVAEHVDVDAVVDAVVAESKLHPELFAHYNKDETRDAIRAQLHRDFASVMDVEHGWHADGFLIGDDGVTRQNLDFDPRSPHVKAFKAERVKVAA